MADYTYAAGTPMTIYDRDTGDFIITLNSPAEISYTDSDALSGFFETTDGLIASSPGQPDSMASYLGYFEDGGTLYAVIDDPSGGTFAVMGISLASELYADRASLSINTGPFAACFAQGTMIAVPGGECAVEDLAIGDLVVTAAGAQVPVRWIGRQTLAKLFFGERAALVRIAVGALGNHSDLYVTGDHGMVLDGYVINASALVNERSIHWVSLDDTPDQHVVYHVETERHDAILANGAVAETYLDIPGRGAFDNFDEYLELYGREEVIEENPFPRITTSRLLPDTIRRRFGIVTQAVI